MQAIASSTSERMPIMCDGSSFSNGNRKPVALVNIVNSRNIAVRPGIRLEPSSPDMTTMPETIAIRLMITCTMVKVDKLMPRIMTRSPFCEMAECYDSRSEITTCPDGDGGDSGIQRRLKMQARIPFIAVTNRARVVSVLATEKLDEFRDHLIRSFFHQPVTAAFDEHALDVGRHHLALLDQERPGGFFP